MCQYYDIYDIILPMENSGLVVAIVEDEESLRTNISYAFKKEGYRVDEYTNGKEAITSFRKGLPDIIISDIMMPLMDGLELCKELRKISDTTPFIFLTSKDEEFDRILGLEIGGDDYLCKPFSLRELITRVKVILRRANYQPTPKLTKQEGIVIDSNSYTCHVNGVVLSLTVSEFRLLESLIENPGFVKTREQLIEAAYPAESYISDRNIDCHIKRLRKKIEKISPGLNPIKTVYGMGYKLVLN